MATKLENITTQYRRFTKNQVLTESHLNEVLDYFDDQVRLSRICLDGVGIVCGFKVTCPNESTLEVTQGAGVTTDGDLFHLFKIDQETGVKIIDIKKLTYTHYQVYENDKSPYTPFFYQENEQIDLYELRTEPKDEESFLLSDLGANEGLNLKDAVVILYLESYEKEQDLCVSLTCDNQGIQLVGNYKLLLTSKSLATHIKSLDETLAQTNFGNLFYQLPDVLHNRCVVVKEDFDNYTKLKTRFADGILKNNLIQRVRQGYNTLLGGMNLFQIRDITNLKLDELFAFTLENVPADFQYRYDLLKDLIDTYNEIKAALSLAEASQCCAPIKAFPKHLMLGEVQRANSYFEFRHGFYKSAAAAQTYATSGDCDAKKSTPTNEDTQSEFVIDFEQANLAVCYTDQNSSQRIKSLIQRAVLMLANYNPMYNFVKATPSRHLGTLSKKTIPFYYNVGNQLISSWDYDKTKIGKHLKNISYHNAFLNIKKPLDFSIDTDFYRIEGHQGKNYKDVLNILKEIKRQKSLAFNVIALPINATDIQDVIENYTSYYMNKNVGLAHKAGVVPGGTFVMIYIEGEYDPYPYGYGYGYNYDYSYEDRIPLASDFVTPKDKIKKAANERLRPTFTGDKAITTRSITGRDELKLNPKKEEVVFKSRAKDDAQKIFNPVVADFMLPYLCCDESLFELSLPLEFLCFTNDTEPIPFEVSPTGGFVEAIIDEGLNGGVVKTNANSFVFDPTLVSQELYGIPIFFKVNNVETETSITVVPELSFTIEIVEINYNNQDNLAIATFTINGNEIPAGQRFEWEFGDGTTPISSSSLTIVHTYSLDTIDAPSVNVLTRADNGECSTEIVTEVVFEVHSEISLDTAMYCRNDDERYPFTVIPRGAQVIIEGDGVILIDTEYFFAPASVPIGSTSIIFSVNGIPSNLSVTIEEAPVANFEHRFEGDALILDNTSDLAVNYEWSIDGETLIRVNRTSVKLTLRELPNTIQISLRANSENCGTGLATSRTIVVREEELTCQDNADRYITEALVGFREIQADPKFQELPRETKTLVQDLNDRFTTVKEDQTKFLSGDRNQDLFEIFGSDIYENLLKRYQVAEASFEVSVMQFLTEATTRLSYTILECQDNGMLDEFQDTITLVLRNLTMYLLDLRSSNIEPDPKDDILNFLVSLKDRYVRLEFILNQINEQIQVLE